MKRFYRMAVLALAFNLAISTLNTQVFGQEKGIAKETKLSPLPVTLTSFGAAEADGKLFVCGGHIGSAHAYSADEQSNKIYVLDLKGDSQWKDFPCEPNIQGLGLVAHQGSAIRVGGFTAKNKKGEDQKLESLATVARFDLATKNWVDLPSLNLPRSSHDAAIAGDTIYAIGGWAMKEGVDTEWHTTMESLDLKAATPTWVSEKVPFQRRALAVVVHSNKIYAIGGMEPEGGPSTAVNVYDLKSKQWSDGPRIPGKPIDGFGIAVAEVQGKLLATTVAGNILILDDNKNEWKEVGKTPTKRFFHRLVASDSKVFVIGGGNMESGKFQDVESIELE